MGVLENLKPERVFYYFEEITKIPHGSRNTQQISDYLVDFAKKHELRYIQDEIGNVIIFKKASEGYENAPTVILQGHIDMVCEKVAGSTHDFTKDPLTLILDGDIIHADGTTLGGDDGIAVAYELAILESSTIAHPALEAIFTVDEEIGLIGATALDTTPLKGKFMINLDSEDEGILCAGCAGGATCESRIPVTRVERTGLHYDIKVHGLLGGHSGAEIDKMRANATLVLARFLHEFKSMGDYSLISICGGQKDNAIPRLAEASVILAEESKEAFEQYAAVFTENLRKEYTGTDEGVTVTVTEKGTATEEVLHPTSREKVLFFLNNYPNGIQKMCGFIDGLVETSCNVGITEMTEGYLVCSASVRSSVGTAKSALAGRIQYLTEFLGGDYNKEGDYPSWEYRADSKLRPIMVDVFKEMYGRDPEVQVIHAGLECGLFYKKIEGLDSISIGPDMRDVHTSEERLYVASVQRVYEYLLEVLKNIR